MDKCNDKIGQNILDKGTDGVTYNSTPDGKYTVIPAEQISPATWSVTSGWNQFMMNVIPGLLMQNANMNPRQARQEEVYVLNLPDAVHDPTLSLASATYTSKNTTLKQIIEDATINYIAGKLDRAGFDKEKARWYTEGGQDALNEYQAAYDATK
jgi:putative aldouronate transport system substrate-binding protein